MDEKNFKQFIDNLLNHTVHHLGIVYDYVMVYNSMAGNPYEYRPGLYFTMIEANTICEIGGHPGVTAAALSRKWCRSQSALSQILKKLEQKEMLTRVYDSGIRGLRLHLTEKGEEFYHNFAKNVREDDTNLYRAILDAGNTPEDIVAFYRVLDCYTKLLRENPEYGSWIKDRAYESEDTDK